MKNNAVIYELITESQGDLADRMREAFDKGFEQGLKDKDNSEEAYQRGLHDAWRCAGKICAPIQNGGLSHEELLSMFGTSSFSKISKYNTASEAIVKIRQYEEQKKSEEEEKELCEEAKQKVEALAEDIGLDQMMDILIKLNGGEK